MKKQETEEESIEEEEMDEEFQNQLTQLFYIFDALPEKAQEGIINVVEFAADVFLNGGPKKAEK